MVNHKLRAARKAKAWTIEMAAEKIGVSPVTYGRWEKGTQTPYLPAVRDICKVFHKSPQDLGLEHLVEEPAEEETKHGTPPFLTQPLATDQKISAITLTQEQVAMFYSLIGDEMKQFDPAKRETVEKLLKTLGIAAGAGLLSPVQGLVQMGTLLHTEEIVAVSATNIPIFWRLYFDGHLAEVGQALPGYLSQLSSTRGALRILACKLPRSSVKHWSTSISNVPVKDYGPIKKRCNLAKACLLSYKDGFTWDWQKHIAI